MDLVHIGFVVKPEGLKEANTQVNKLLDKVEQVGTKGKKSASEFENSQKKVKASSEQATKGVDKTTKALEKQRLIGDYLGKGLDKTTASTVAGFKQLGASVSETSEMLGNLANQKGILQARKDLDMLAKQQAKAAADVVRQEQEIEKARQKRLSSEQKYYLKTQEEAKKSSQKEDILRQKRLLSEQNYYVKVQEQAKQLEVKRQVELSKTAAKEESLRQKRLLAEQNYYLKVQEDAKKAQAKEQAILDQTSFKEEKLRQQRLLKSQQQYLVDMENLKKFDQEQEKARQRKFSAEQKQYQRDMEALKKSQDAQEALRAKILGATQSRYVADMEKVQKLKEAEIAREKQANNERQKAITLEQTKAKYINEGFGKGSSTQLAKMELSGADVTTLDNYKASLLATSSALGSFAGSAKVAKEEKSKFLDQVKGIAVYAALSAAIYGVMTAMTSLAVATVKMADEYTAIQNRMKLYISDAQELSKVNRQLAQFSTENNVGLRETATLFSRLAPSMQKLGANTAAITTVVDAFGKSMRIGGATAMEAASATIQFSQAMASGKLAGDEFRSISEASPRFLKAIAEGSGIAADKLKEMSAAGMLTTQVISKALLKEYPKLIEENKKLGVTLEQGANAIKTGFLVAIGEFNEGAGITKALGEAMMDLAQGMLVGAQNARQFGKDISSWFSDNAGLINGVAEAFKALAVIITTRYVVSVVLATKESIRYQLALLGMSAQQANVTRSATIMTTAINGVSAAMKGVLGFFGGWAGLALTVVGVASSYLLMRDNAAQANTKLVEQSEYANKATSELSKLNAEQKKNAGFKLTLDISEANANLEKAQSSYVALVQVMSKTSWTGRFSKEVNNIAKAVNEGTMSFDAATRKLLEMGAISEEQAQKLNKQTDIYNEAANSAGLLSKAAQALGVDFKLGGNEAQNATPAITSLKDQTKQLGDEAVITGSKFNKMADDFKKAAADSRATLAVMKQYNLDAAFAEKLVKSSQARFNSTQGNIDSTLEKIKAAEKLLNRLDKNDPSRASVQATLDRAKASLKVAQEAVNLGKQADIRNLAPLALDAQNAAEAVSDLTASRKKSEKDEDKLLNKSKKITEAYQEQVEYVTRLQGLLASGLKADAAKIAAEKDYAKTIVGTSLAVDIAEANRQLAITEHNIALEEEQRILAETLKLMNRGATLEQARTLAQAGYLDDALGALAVEFQIVNELEAKRISLIDQARTQKDINFFLAQGLNLEQAITEATFARLKFISGGLSAERQQMKDKINEQQRLLKARQVEQQFLIDFNKLDKQRILFVNAQADSYAKLATNIAIANKLASNPDLTPAQARQLVEAEELLSFEKEMASLKMQTYIATLNESDAVKQLLSTYTTLDSVQIGQYDRQQKILAISKELSAEAEKQRNNPLGDFSNISFDVFGDIGNPFEDALNGLNEFLARTQESRELLSSLEQDIVSAKQAGLDVTNLEIEKNQVLMGQEKERSAAIDKGFTTTLSLAKSFFKEESKGYKIVSGMEKAYQTSKIAFALWEKKDAIKTMAIKLAGYAKDMAMFIGGVATKITAQMGLNVVQAQGAVASAAQAPPPVGFASAAAMIALLAGIGIAVGGGGGSSGSFAAANTGTGTVFGDSEAQSASIANSIDLLSENSDLMLPLTSAMLRSLRNIESSIGGVTNLILRQETGQGFNIVEGFNQNAIGGFLEKAGNSFFAGIGDFLGINKMLGGLLGGLFGSKTTVKGQGLFGGAQSLGDILSGGFDLQEYVDVQVKKKSFGVTTSTKNKTKFAEANKELEKQFTLIFGGFYDSILSATDILGANTDEVKTKLENAIIKIGKINLKGLNGEQIQEKLEAVFGAAADSLAQQGFAGLEDFQTVGEGYYETLIKVATGVEQAKYFTDRLNVTAIEYTDILNKQGDVAAEIVRQSVLLNNSTKDIKGGFYDLVNSFDGTAEELTDFVLTLRDLQDQLFMTGKNADFLTSSMILGAGGLDSLASGLDAYFEMLSPAEQAAELTRRLTNEFAIFGKELPADVKAFRNLVSSIDISTEAGQKLYGQILALAPEFNDLQDAIKNANSDVNALVQSLRDLAEQARAARGETEQPRNLAYLRNEFNKASDLALQGDTEAAARLVSLGKDLMSMSKLYAVSGSDYARDLAFIQGIASAVADMQESGLGTSISPDLKPSTTTGTTTPTLETTNTTMTTEMQTMREEFNAGLFAIAKFVQNLDSRTERWDDGNRVMVGVQPENGDTPLPVVVTP